MEQKLLFLINHEWTSPTLDRLMAVASSAALWAVPLAVAVLALAIWGGFKGRAFAIVALAAFGLSDGVFGKTIKHAVGRLRPHQSEVGVRQLDLARPAWRGLFAPLKEKISLGTGRDEEGRSFPSNHATNTTAVALIATLFWRRRGWLAFVPALIVAWSRIYTGAHWPLDVAAGICLGIGVALLTFALAEWAWRRFSPRLSPRLAALHPSLLSA